MKPVRSLSLKFWLPMLLSVIFALLLLTSIWIEYHQSNTNLIEASVREVTRDLTSLQQQLNYELGAKDFNGAQRALSSRGINTNYKTLLASDDTGRILYAIPPALKKKQVNDVLPDMDRQNFLDLQHDNLNDVHYDPNRRQITAYFPLTLTSTVGESQPSRTGALFAIYDLNKDLAQVWNQTWRDNLLVWLILIIAMAALLGFLQHFVTRPTKYLASAALAFAKGETGEFRRLPGKGELASLGESLYQMSTQIGNRFEQYRHAEQALRDSREQLLMAQHIAHLGFFYWNLDTDEITLSDEACQILGLSQGTVKASADLVASVVHPEDLERVVKGMRMARNGEDEYSIDHRIVRPDGEVLWVQAQAVLLGADNEGQSATLLGTVLDITWRKQAEERWKESEEKFSKAFHDHPAPMEIVNLRTGERIECNRSLCKLVGVEKEALQHSNLFEKNNLAVPSAAKNLAARILKDGYIRNFPVDAVNKSNETLHLLISAAMLDTGDGNLAVLSMIDVTERRLVEEQQQQTEAILSLQAKRAEALRTLPVAAEGQDEHTFMQRSLDTVEELTDSCISFAHIVSEDEQTVESFIWSRTTLDNYCRATEDKQCRINELGIWSDAIREQKPVVTNDYSVVENQHDLPEGHAKLERIIILPVVQNGRVVLLLGVGNKATDYNDLDVETVQMIADAIWHVVQQRRAEGEINRFSRVLEQSLNEIYIFDAGTLRMVNVNLGARTNLGYSMDELLSMTPVDLKPEFTQESFVELLEPLRSGAKKEIVITTAHQRKDGSRYQMQAHIQLMDENPPVFVAMVRDIDERLELESEMRKLAQAVEQSPDSIVITNTHAEIEYVNKAYVDASGYSKEELLGGNPNILKSGKTPKETYAELWASLKRGQAWQGEFTNRRKDGSEYIEWAHIVPLSQPDGLITHYVEVKQDITEKKQLATELEAHRHHLEELVEERTAQLAEARKKAETANQAKSAFLANMSHEIRTPMSAIVGLTHLLQREQPTAQQAARLSKIDTSAAHLLAIINDILDLSKIEAGKLTLEHEDFRLDIIFDQVRSLFKDQLAASGLHMEVESDDVPSWLRGDATRLRQALINYVGNAIKFTRHGRITLRVHKVQETKQGIELCFEVTDTGIGIDADTLKGLFEAFEQADVSTTREYGGTGLGLAVTKRLVHLMGGETGARSTPGEGSTFWFTAWLGHAHGVQTATDHKVLEDAEVQLHNQYAGTRILLVEDNAINCEVAMSLLSGAGLVVDTAMDGLEAIECARSTAYALILMDVQMPRMDGMQATREIRTLDGYAAVPVLAMTANVFIDDREAYMAAGMDDFVAKPVEPDNLFSTILKWLSSSGPEQ